METFIPQTKQESLALDIAQAFRDENNLKIYLYICKTYPENAIQRAYGEAKQTPASVIRKSRGALFVYLTKKYAQEQSPENSID